MVVFAMMGLGAVLFITLLVIQLVAARRAYRGQPNRNEPGYDPVLDPASPYFQSELLPGTPGSDSSSEGGPHHHGGHDSGHHQGGFDGGGHHGGHDGGGFSGGDGGGGHH